MRQLHPIQDNIIGIRRQAKIMVKLAFSTLGCPQWKLDAILKNAEKMGFDGVDFRGYLAETDIYKCREFSSDANATARSFRDAGIDIPCFSSSAKLGRSVEYSTLRPNSTATAGA